MAKKILFVDDEPEIRDLMKINLESLGVDVELASSGGEAIILIENHLYDMIISDVKMPKGSGVELLQALNNKNISTPFIFLTAYLDLDSKKLMELGAAKVFYKPTKFSEIESFIKSTLKM